MFTGPPVEYADRERQARDRAVQVAALLSEIDALGLGPTTGRLTTPGAGTLRKTGDTWEIR
ncbi:hypothetical protein ACQEVS_32915 [Streptomyces sp. CA-181903]|uniref:hypothetical protein n=1 Tax=Streptomyces sp. CA-181903 TaxID=3240055 RepID=UPI003D8EAA35